MYFDLPGELAPKLALGLAAEMAGNLDWRSKMYDLVSRTDPGLCRRVRAGAVPCMPRDSEGRGGGAESRAAGFGAVSAGANRGGAHLDARERLGPGTRRTDVGLSGCGKAALEGMGRLILRSQILRTALEVVALRKGRKRIGEGFG